MAQDIADRAQNALTAEIRVAVPERSLKHDLRAVSIVWRREFGFLREMLVAPVRRRDDGGARIKQIQAFMALTRMFVMPLFFLSGALYPLSGLPSWLRPSSGVPEKSL